LLGTLTVLAAANSGVSRPRATPRLTDILPFLYVLVRRREDRVAGRRELDHGRPL
jgi:hypothetical protein